MPKPFALVEIEDGSASNSAVYGAQDYVSIVVDWDEVDSDSGAASDLIDEINLRFLRGETKDASVLAVIDRLQDIVDDDEEEPEEEDDDDFEDEDYDDEAELEAEDEQRG